MVYRRLPGAKSYCPVLLMRLKLSVLSVLMLATLEVLLSAAQQRDLSTVNIMVVKDKKPKNGEAFLSIVCVCYGRCMMLDRVPDEP